MTRIAVSIQPTEGTPDHLPGLYVAELQDGATIDRWARLERIESYFTPDPNDGVFAMFALLAPNGEVSVWNANLGDVGYLGTPAVTVDVIVQNKGSQWKTPSTWLPDACGAIVREPSASNPSRAYLADVLRDGPSLDDAHGLIEMVPLFPGVNDITETSAPGSSRMAAHYAAGVRGEAHRVHGDFLNGDSQRASNLLRPVHGFFWDASFLSGERAVPFLGVEHPKATSHGGYSNRGGWGTVLYGTSEHFGRPVGPSVSPWEPDDHLHLALHQWCADALLTGSAAMAYHVVATLESLWVQVENGVWDAARAYGPILGVCGEILLYAHERVNDGDEWWFDYRDHLLTTYIPKVLAKLEHENARANDLDNKYGEAPRWQANVLTREGKADHLEDGQTIWMTGQLVLGAQKLMRWLLYVGAPIALYKRVRMQFIHAASLIVRHAWGLDPNGRGWPEDACPFNGLVNPSSKDAIGGKYRQYILPALMVARRQFLEDAANDTTPEMQRDGLTALADEAWHHARWLARQLVGTDDKPGSWYGSASAADKGWSTFLADEGWLMAGALGAVTPADWRAALTALGS